MPAQLAEPPRNAANIPAKALWGSIGLLVLGSWALFRFLSIEWSVNPQYSYGWGVPFMAAYLFAKRWKDRPAAQPTRIGGILGTVLGGIALAALPFMIILEANSDWRIILWAASLAYVTTLLIWVYQSAGVGWVWHFAPAICFLLLATPWPSGFEGKLIQWLTREISAATVEAMRWFGYPSVLRGSVIQLANADVGVDQACSGIRSFQTTVMLTIFFGELYRLSMPRRVALFVGGLCWSILINFSRTAFLTWITAEKGAEAQNRVHDAAGLVALGVGIAGLLALAALLARGRKAPSETESPRADSAAMPALLPWRVIVIIAAILLTMEVVKEAWFRFREPPAQSSAAWNIKWPSPAEGFTQQNLSEDVLAVLRTDSHQSGIWKRPDKSEWTIFFTTWRPGHMPAPLARCHTPDVCLPNSGYKLISRSTNFVASVGGIQLPFASYVFEGDGRPWYVFFCLVEDRLRDLPPPDRRDPNYIDDLNRKQRLLASWEGKRYFGLQMLEIAMDGYRTEAEARRALEDELPRLIIPKS